jgi:hypothetical protein
VLRSLDQRAPVQLGVGRALALSGDGSRALITLREEKSDRFRIVPTGAGEPRELAIPGMEFVYTASFFADGKRVALFGRRGEEASRVFVLDTDSGQLRAISPPLNAGYTVAVSPDQRWVAASDTDKGPALFPVDGGAADRIPELGPKFSAVGWLRDQTLLAFERNALPSPVVRFDPKTRQVTPFRTLAPPDMAGVPRLTKVLATPDGKTFAFHFRRRTDVLYLLDPVEP